MAEESETAGAEEPPDAVVTSDHGTGTGPISTISAEADPPAPEPVPDPVPEPEPELEEPGDAAPDPAMSLLIEISAATRRLADSAEHYRVRAEQREAVIDHQRAEVDRLRLGERRGLLRPLLVEICRLRNDLLRQAGELPVGFDAEQAALLLRSYAESIEIALENSGVRGFAPEVGDPFDARTHRRVGGRPTEDPGLAGRVFQVAREGYLDVDSGSPIAPAEVTVYGPVTAAPRTRTDEPDSRTDEENVQ